MKRKKSATNNEGLVGEQELEILEESGKDLQLSVFSLIK